MPLGKLQIALAAYEAQGRYDLAHVASTAARDAEGWRITGRKSIVLDAPSADHFLISARSSGNRTDASGISLFLVRRDAPGLTLQAYPTQSGGRAADLQLQDVRVGDDAVIGAPEDALPVIERAVDHGIAALCAEALGIVTALNEATLNYLKTRKQFGTVIGSFQVLQHRMADMFIAAEQIRSMAIVAAFRAPATNPRRAAARYRARRPISERPRASSASRPSSCTARWESSMSSTSAIISSASR